MPDEAPVAATETPAEDLSPAVAAAPITIPGPDAMMAAIRERLAAANPPADAPKPDKPADEPTLNIDPKTMKTLARLQKEAREAASKVQELEPLRPDAEFGKQLKDLWKGSPEQRLEALARLSGRDGTDELAALVQFFYERDQATAGDPADPAKPQPSAETKAMLDVVAELKKEISDLKAHRDSTTEGKAKAEAENDRKNAAAFVERFLTANKEKFEISARKENVTEATDLIQEAALAIIARDKLDVKGLTEQAANDLYLQAAAAVEREYEETGKRFAKTEPPKWAFNPDKYARPLSRPAVVVKRDPPSTDPKVREQQLRERLVRMRENGELGR
jgi:hypothetical protein